MLLVGIAIPSGNEWKADFAMSLINLQRACMEHPNVKGYSGIGIKVFNRRGSNLLSLRQGLVEEAINQQCSHILFLDSDMYFPAMLLHMLARHRRSVVTCNCATKAIPSSPTARLKDGTETGKVLYTTKDNKELVKVWRVGTGIMLIDLKVFSKLKKPWFNFTYTGNDSKSGRAWHGEDWYLCQLLEKANVDIFVDQEASWHIGHIGSFIYSHLEVEQIDEPELKLVKP